jgi:hypothetical protein
MMRRLVWLVGASGVGKTTVAEVLERRLPWTGNTYFFDSIGVPSPEEMDRRFGGGDGWQQWALGLPVLDTDRVDPAAIAADVERLVCAEGMSESAL